MAIAGLLITVVVGITAYYGYTKVVREFIDSPENNPRIKPQEGKSNEDVKNDLERRATSLRDSLKKDLEEQDRLLSAEFKKFSVNNLNVIKRKIKETQESLKEVENDLYDYSILENDDWGGYKKALPSKITPNNIISIAIFLTVLVAEYQFLREIFKDNKDNKKK